VCQHLGIDHYVIDMKKQFKDHVMDPFCKEYLQARTPNPCIECNRHIKFGAMLDWALEQGFEGIATGHYVLREEQDDEYTLKRSSAGKDQSYVLWRLTQHQIAHTLFPLCNMEKTEIRELIKDAGLPVFAKKDSQDICFVPDGDYAAHIEKYYQNDTIRHMLNAGSFVDAEGNKIGRHSGMLHYTIGQRKGLGGGFSQPMFVLKLLPESNEIVIGTNEQCKSSKVYCTNTHIISEKNTRKNFTCTVKLRYAARPAQAQVTLEENRAVIELQEPQRAVTPGQSAVFYDGDTVIGGAIIESAE